MYLPIFRFHQFVKLRISSVSSDKHVNEDEVELRAFTRALIKCIAKNAGTIKDTNCYHKLQIFLRFLSVTQHGNLEIVRQILHREKCSNSCLKSL